MKIKNDEMFFRQVLQLHNDSYVRSEIEKTAKKAYNSGAINTDDLDSEKFGQAKIVLAIVYQNLSDEVKPTSEKHVGEFKNLKNFI